MGDIIISTPPYLPKKTGNHPQTTSLDAIQDITLIDSLINVARKKRVPLVLGYSNLIEEKLDSALSNSGSSSRLTLAEREVPLRITLSQSYKDWLCKEKGLQERLNDVFRYWHKIKVILI
jgi:hypothetical protein